MACVYRIWSRDTGHYYIGATDNLRRRETRHRLAISRGGSNKRWKSLLSDKSLRCEDNWVMDVVKEFETLDEAARAESSLLQFHVGLPLCLNSNRTNPVTGTLSPSARDKLSGRTYSVESIERMRQAAMGNQRTKGLKHPPRSDEFKKRMSDMKKELWARKRAEKAARDSE